MDFCDSTDLAWILTILMIFADLAWIFVNLVIWRGFFDSGDLARIFMILMIFVIWQMHFTKEKHASTVRKAKIRYKFRYFWEILCFCVFGESLKKHNDFPQDCISETFEFGRFFGGTHLTALVMLQFSNFMLS